VVRPVALYYSLYGYWSYRRVLGLGVKLLRGGLSVDVYCVTGGVSASLSVVGGTRIPSVVVYCFGLGVLTGGGVNLSHQFVLATGFSPTGHDILYTVYSIQYFIYVVK